jgi:hypothetical protein
MNPQVHWCGTEGGAAAFQTENWYHSTQHNPAQTRSLGPVGLALTNVIQQRIHRDGAHHACFLLHVIPACAQVYPRAYRDRRDRLLSCERMCMSMNELEFARAEERVCKGEDATDFR